MDTISLFYFTEAVKDLNFTQTASRLFMSQQNLSNHILRLENMCGCKLFQRKPRLQLTYEGKLFLEYAKSAVDAEKNVLSSLKSVAEEEAGQVVIGSTTPRAAFFVPEIMPKFTKRFPRVSLRLLDQPSYILQSYLQDNTVDFCVGVFHFQSPELQTRRLLHDRVYLCISEELLLRYCPDALPDKVKKFEKGIFVSELPGLPVVLPPDDIGLSKVILSCYSDEKVSPNICLTTTYPQLFAKLCIGGTAAMFVTEMNMINLRRSVPHEAVSRFYSFPLVSDRRLFQFRREVSLATNRNRYLSQPTQYLIDLTVSLFRSLENDRENKEETADE